MFGVLVNHLLIYKVCDGLGIKHGDNSLLHENYIKDHASRTVGEPVEKSAPSLIDIPKDMLSGELVEDELRIISGMLVSCLTSFLYSVPENPENFDHEQDMV